MENQELLLLTILKFPVIVIKFIAKAFSILTYLPNYVLLFLIDALLFHQKLQATLLLYMASWLPRVALLFSAVALFAAEFYLIFDVMLLHQHGLVIQITGMILTLAGSLILMRKGYLTLLEKYNLTKLKSPMEHIELGLDYLVDCIGILLWIINAVLLINIGRSWDYRYDKTTKYQFLRHIFNLIRESLIAYIEFFYVKIFFKMFPWRFIREINTYRKEKSQKNVLNCIVLLTLLFLSTLLDILVVLLLGLPCVIHYHRSIYFKQLGESHQKYKITAKMFFFVVLHTIQLVIELICFVFCWSNGAKALKKWIKIDRTDQLFGSQLQNLIIETFFKIPFILSTVIIALSIYKLKRKNYLLEDLNNKQKGTQQKKQDELLQSIDNEQIWITFQCLAELLWDICFFPLILISTLLKPWKLWWLKYLIDQDYSMNHHLITTHFSKSFVELLLLPFALLTSILIFLYDYRKPLSIYHQAGKTILDLYHKELSTNAAPLHPEIHELTCQSQLVLYLCQSLQCMKSDIPHLPEFFIAKMTFLNVYFPEMVPTTTPDLFVMLQRSYYYLTAKKSIRFEDYSAMFHRIKASGGLINIKEEYRFWKYAYKCQRLLLIQSIMSVLLPKKSVERIRKRIEKKTEYSEIANLYWYQRDLAIAMVIRFIYLIIETILTLIGLVFLLPLTLWRIPTFMKLFLYHKARKYFFPILLKTYYQMVIDVITIPLKLLAFLIAPRMYLSFLLKTSFKYGPVGIETFEIYQRCKRKYFSENIINASLVAILLHFQIIFICIFWIRIKSLKMLLRTERLNLVTLYTEILLIGPKVPTMELMITQPITEPKQLYSSRLNAISEMVSSVLNETIQDIPYLLLMLLIFITMPWRINYLIQTVKDMREDSQERKSFFKLIRNFFKDYACIFLNIVLLISIFKTKKALFLIRRNYRLNFFIGFLEYSYFTELINEIVSLGKIYKNFFFFVVAVLFGWTRTHQLIDQLKYLRKKQKQEQESAAANKKIYENTVKSGKELQTLHKMGYYNYITVCSFLTVPEIIKLRQVDQFNYMMTQRQEIWFMKWETTFSKASIQLVESFQIKCRNAFLAQIGNQQKATYETIIMNHFRINVFEKSVDLADFLRGKISNQNYRRIFTNYEFSITQGYGPENELPKQENEDEQFLRLTNQVRRPIVELDENTAWIHLLYFRSLEFIVQKLHRYFRQDRKRKLKQLSFILLIASILISICTFTWTLREYIFRLDSLLGIKLLLAFYILTYLYVFILRCSMLIQNWISLIPFDLYYDIVKFIKHLGQLIQQYVLTPVKMFFKKCGRAIASIAKVVYYKIKLLCLIIWEKVKQLFEKVKQVSVKAKDATVKYSIIAYEKVVKPLYLSIADKIRKLKDLIVAIFTALFQSIKSMLAFLGNLITSFYSAIRAVFSNINKLYYFILESSMRSLLKFGAVGNLIFTLFGLLLMTLPSLIWWIFYQKRWYLVVSTIHTMVLIVVGYKHLNRIRMAQN